MIVKYCAGRYSFWTGCCKIGESTKDCVIRNILAQFTIPQTTPELVSVLGTMLGLSLFYIAIWDYNRKKRNGELPDSTENGE